MKSLIYNEFEKLIKGRLLLIAVLLAVLFPVFAVSQQSRYLKEAADRDPAMIEQKIKSYEEKLQDPNLTAEQKASYNKIIESFKLAMDINQKKKDAFKAENERADILEARRLEGDYLERTGLAAENIFTINSFTILSRVLVSDEFLVLFLIVVLLGAYIVSSEYQPATIKTLITRAVPRWKILLSKYMVLFVSTTVITLISISATFILAGLQFGWGQANYPVSVGGQFAFDGNPMAMFLEGSMHVIPRWIFAAASSAHAVFACITAATAAFAISTVVTKKILSLTISFMGIIGIYLFSTVSDVGSSAGLVNFMSYMSLDPIWSGALQSKAMNGNVSVGFAEGVLAIWLIVPLVTSFFVFKRRDVMN